MRLSTTGGAGTRSAGARDDREAAEAEVVRGENRVRRVATLLLGAIALVVFGVVLITAWVSFHPYRGC